MSSSSFSTCHFCGAVRSTEYPESSRWECQPTIDGEVVIVCPMCCTCADHVDGCDHGCTECYGKLELKRLGVDVRRLAPPCPSCAKRKLSDATKRRRAKRTQRVEVVVRIVGVPARRGT